MAVTTALVLISPQDLEPFQVEVDSLDFVTGAVLSQQSTTDGKWHPVAFYSKSLSSVEWNYEIHDKEILAIIHTLEEWRYFLEGATCKGDWGTRLQENPQFILHLVVMIQLTFRRILRD